VAFTCSAYPITARIGTRLFGRELKACAVQRIELSPAVRVHRPAALALPGELERVTGYHNCKPEQVREHLTEGEQDHDATVAYRVPDAILADGCAYSRTALESPVKGKRRMVLAGISEELPEAQLCTTNCGSLFFGDWLTNDLGLELLAEQRGIPAVSLASRTYALHEPGYRDCLGLPAPRRPDSIIRAASLWIVEDNGMTANRVARLETMRSRNRVPGSGPRRVYIDRGTGGIRCEDIGNKVEVVAALQDRGFEAIYPERMTVDEIRRALSSAEIAVGLDGSALAHATMALPRGSSILFIFPNDRFFTQFKWFTDAFGQRFAWMIGKRVGAQVMVDVPRLHATLDLIEAASKVDAK
jgi:capsular polysaccharide biosynthesis protein